MAFPNDFAGKNYRNENKKSAYRTPTNWVTFPKEPNFSNILMGKGSAGPKWLN